MNILILGHKDNINYFRRSLEDITDVNTIYETYTFEGFFSIAKGESYELAIIDSRLIKNNIEGKVYSIINLIPEILIFDKYCRCIQVRRCTFDTPSRVWNAMREIIERLNNKTEEKEMLILKTKSEMISVNKKDIVFIESFKGKCVIHTRRRIIQIRRNLKDFEKKLGEDFLRVHRSFLVNMNEIRRVKIVCERSYEIEFVDFDKTALMSRYRYQSFKDYVENL